MATESTPLISESSAIVDEGLNEIEVWDPYDPLNYLGGRHIAIGCGIFFAVAAVIGIAFAFYQGLLTPGVIASILFKIVANLVAFAVISVVICCFGIWQKKRQHAKHNEKMLGQDNESLEAYEAPVDVGYKPNVELAWTPAVVELCKDLLLLALAVWTVQNGSLKRLLPLFVAKWLSFYAWPLLLAIGIFALQRFSLQGKRRLILIVGMPLVGMIMLLIFPCPQVQRTGIAILWGSLLETCTAIVLMSRPAWCAHYSDQDAEAIEQAMPKMRTGDILLFTGCERSSTLLRFFTGGDWSHVAMLLVRPPQEIKEKLAPSWHLDSECPVWVLEADPEYVDFVRGEKLGHTGGVQLVPIDEYLQNLDEWYQGQHVVAVRHLIMPEDKDRNQDEHSPLKPEDPNVTWNSNFPKLKTWLLEHGDGAYESSSMDLFRAVIKNNKNVMKIEELFCSELVAQCYMSMRLLRKDISSDNYSPRDFCSLSPWNLNLQRGAGLALERRILR